MSPSTAGRVTPWGVKENANFMGHRVERRDEPRGVLLFLGSTTFEDATLIATALNALESLNPTDPLSAAQGLEELVKWAGHCAEPRWGNLVDRDYSHQQLKIALSRVTGKPA